MKNPKTIIKTNPFTHEIEKPEICLQKRDGTVLGSLLYSSLKMSLSATQPDEVCFEVYKEIDGQVNPLWNDVVDLKLINVVGYKRFQISVSKDSNDSIVKTVLGKSLEVELDRPLYDLHINDDYYFEYADDDDKNADSAVKPIKFYNELDHKHSLLHLLLEDKAPDWSIGHVPEYLTITNLGNKKKVLASSFQRTFTIDGQTIYDFLVGDLASEANIVYDFDTYNRIINIYDKFEIGEDTNVFINKNNLAKNIKIENNSDQLKNCFRVLGGDDIINNYLSAVNITGNYIWKFSDIQLNDMPKGLSDAVKNYLSFKDTLNDAYYGGYDVYSEECETLEYKGVVNSYSNLPDSAEVGNYYYVSNESQYYVKNKTEWELCGAFVRLCAAYDKLSWLESSMMPDVSLKSTKATEQTSKIQTELASASIGVNNLDLYTSSSFDGVTNNVIAYIKVITDSRYKVENVTEVGGLPTYNASTHTWNGKVKVTRVLDENDTDTVSISVNITDDEMTYAKQKIMKSLSSNDMYEVDLDVIAYNYQTDVDKLVTYFDMYCLNRLKSFYDGYQACLSTIMSMQSSSKKSSVYETLYKTYYTRCCVVEQIYNKRKKEVETQQAFVNAVVAEKNVIQQRADFKTYINNIDPTYWKLFNSYRREDVYQNNNYVSDGLTDGEIIAKCKELLNYADYQLSMACQLQRTLSIDLNNLLVIDDFKPFWDKFALFNYIRIEDDDEILKLRLMQIDIDFDAIDQFNVSFADNMSGNGNVLEDVYETITEMKSIATSYNSTKQQVNQGKDKISKVGEWIKNGLNAAKTIISTSDDNEVTINNCGINLKDMSDEGNYGEFQTRLIGNGFFFTTDAWGSVATALGRIWIQDSETEGHWATGLIADNVIGNLIAGQSLMITNNKGSVKIDGDTALFTDITINYVDDNGNSVKIGGNEDRIFAIANKDMELLYFDSTKNRMVFSGDVVASTFTGGTITGATVNGTTINGGTVNSGEFIGGKFIGGSIDIGDGQFTVDETGHMTARDGEFSGDIVGGSIKIGKNGNEYNFIVDKNGNVDAKSGKFKGDIVASKLYSQQAYDDLVESGKTLTNGTYFDLDEGNIQIRNDMELIAGNDETKTMIWMSTQSTPHKGLNMASFNLGSTNYEPTKLEGAKDETDEQKRFRALVHMRGDGYVRFGLEEADDAGSIKFNFNKNDNDTPGRSIEYLMYTKNFRISADGSVYIKSDSIGGSSVPDVFVPSEGSNILIEDVEIKYDGSNPIFYFSKATTVKEVTLVLNKDHSPKDETDGLVFNDVYSGYKVGGLETGSIYYGKLFTTVDEVTSSSDVFMVNIELSENDIVSFADGTWSQISKMLDMHYAKIIDIADYWKVGDEKEILIEDIPGYTYRCHNTGGSDYDITFETQPTQKVSIVILDINKDVLQKSIGLRYNAALTIGIKNCLFEKGAIAPYSYYLYYNIKWTMNHGEKYAIGRRYWLLNSFLQSLPSGLQSLLKNTLQTYHGTSNTADYCTAYEPVFLFDEVRLYNSEYYKDTSKRVKYDADGNAIRWWIANAYQNIILEDGSLGAALGSKNCACMTEQGNISQSVTSALLGISPCFAI